MRDAKKQFEACPPCRNRLRDSTGMSMQAGMQPHRTLDDEPSAAVAHTFFNMSSVSSESSFDPAPFAFALVNISAMTHGRDSPRSFIGDRSEH